MRVLLVEDEHSAAEMLAKGLREQTFAVDIAEDGESALELAFVNRYDLIVLDCMLPEKDGYTVCSELRQQGITTPVLMLTARDTVDDRIHGLDSGADDYLVKPFHFRELLARLRALLRRGPALLPETIVVSDLAIDTRSRLVTRGGRRIELTAKEYALLEFLSREAGRVVNRTDIAESVWADDYDPFSNLIEVYIQRLRRKLNDNGEQRLIHTRRGEGYVLAAIDERTDD